MKESTAWLILAEEHDAKRTHSQFLCISLDTARTSVALSSIPDEVRSSMIQRIRLSLEDRFVAYDEDEKVAPDVRPARVLACLLFSEQAKEEAR